jgi:hypothetical protein
MSEHDNYNYESYSYNQTMYLVIIYPIAAFT